MGGKLGERLRKEREDQQLTHEQLAYKVKAKYPEARVTQQSLSQLETGQTERTAYIVELAVTLGVLPEWLATGAGPKHAVDLATLDKADADGLRAFQRLKPDQKPHAIRFFDSIAEPDPNHYPTSTDKARPKKRRRG